MVLAFLLAALSSTSAVAKDRPTIAFVGVHDAGLDEAAQRRLAETVADVVEDDKRFDALTPDDVARALVGREELILAEAVFGPGRRLLEDGRILHDQAEPEQAAPVLQQAVDNLEAAMATADSSRDLWEAYLYLGSAHRFLDNEEQAKAAWARAVAINPDRQPDTARIPPATVAAFRAVQAQSRANPGKLVVKAEGAVRFQLNEREIEGGTLRLDDVLPGTVHVRAIGDDGRVAYRALRVTGGETTEATLELGPATLPQAGSTEFLKKRATADLYKALGTSSRADLLLVAGRADDKATLQVFSPAGDTFSRPLEVAYEGTSEDEIIAALPELLSVVTDAGTLPAIATSPTSAGLDPSANRLLAALLLDPQPLAAPTGGGGRSGRGVKWWQLAAGSAGLIVVGSGVTALAIFAGGDGNQGTIVVGPVP